MWSGTGGMHILSWAAIDQAAFRGSTGIGRNKSGLSLGLTHRPRKANAMAGRPGSKHIRQCLGLRQLNPALRSFNLQRRGPLAGRKTSRDMKKDCGEPGLPKTIAAVVRAGSARGSNLLANGRFRTFRRFAQLSLSGGGDSGGHSISVSD